MNNNDKNDFTLLIEKYVRIKEEHLEVERQKLKLEKKRQKNIKLFNAGLASFSICLAGSFAMWITEGETGIGWAAFGLWLIWS